MEISGNISHKEKMFSGSYLYNIDGKGRVSLPVRLRKQINKEANNTFILLYEMEKCLVLFPADEWTKKEEKIQNLSEYDEIESYVRREFSSRAFEVELDKQSRILIPQMLLDISGLKKDGPVLILGHLNKIELWDPEEYDNYRKRFDKPFGEYIRLVKNGI